MVLPVELYRDIIDHVEDKADLLPLLHVSSMMRVEAQRRLYYQITFGNPRKTASERVVAHWIDFVGVIGKFTRRLDLRAYDENLNDAKAAERVTAAYNGLINLKELSLPSINTGSLVPPLLAPFKLLYFDVTVGNYGSTSTVLAEKIIPFLDSQPSIRDLDLFCDATKPLPLSLLPNLSVLASKTSLAFRLLPGRSITHLYLCDSEPLHPVDEMKGFTTIRSLSLDLSESLELFEHCFVILEFLELKVGLVEEVVSSLGRMPRLCTLRLVATDYCRCDSTMKLKLVAQLFRAAPSLQTVYMSLDPYWPSLGDGVDAWKRDEVSATEVTWHDDAWKLV